ALATSEQLGTMHVPRSKICPSSQACIFMLDINWAAWGGRQRGMFASPGLNAGLLVGAQHVVARPQGCAPSSDVDKDPRLSPPWRRRLGRVEISSNNGATAAVRPG